MDSPRERASARDQVPGIALALAAGLHKVLLASVLVNDDFMHRAYSRQLLAGEWPVRDFFDYGMGLMYAVSAAAQLVFGNRLLSEAIVIGVATAVGDVPRLRRRPPRHRFEGRGSNRRADAGRGGAARLRLPEADRVRGGGGALVAIRLGARTERKAIVLGLWAGIAFYWRPDHGAYVAAGSGAGHGGGTRVPPLTVVRCVQAGAAAIALVTPYLVFASAYAGGLVAFVQSGVTAASEEHRSTGRVLPSWPVRHGRDLVAVDPAEKYAPEIGIRWTRDSSADARRNLLEKYGLTVVATRNSESQQVRLSTHAVRELRALLAEPIVEDTDGVDRGPARLPASTWPAIDSWRFRHWWLRVRVLPGLYGQARAGEAAAVLLFLLPVMAMIAAVPRFRQALPGADHRSPLVCFGLFALLVDFGLLRTPFSVRVRRGRGAAWDRARVAGWRSSGGCRPLNPRWRRWLPRAAAVALVVLVAHTLAEAGQSGERVTWVAGGWTSLNSSRGAREEVSERLWSNPPIEYWRNRKPEITLRLAGYARECVAPADRILVLWFAPEIYYYSNRLMAGRHVFFLPALRTLSDEQRMEMEKLERFPPQLAFARSPTDRPPTAFPDLVDMLVAGLQRCRYCGRRG